ncbi:MAG: sporulation protein YunB [Firmicutes bacterium]|nr:sporulation protein YunB [Bacillota bacterium]
MMIKRSGGRQKKRRRSIRLLLLLCLAAALLVCVELLLAPIIAAAAAQHSRSLAMNAMTEAIQAQSSAARTSDYRNLVQVETDDQGRVTLLVTDTQRLNQLVSAVSLDAAERLEQLSRQQLQLPLGSVLGSVLLSGSGPPVAFRFSALGAPQAELRDSFTAAGVNQTRHSIYLELSCGIRVIAPFSRQELLVSTTMLLAEGIIVGYVPDTYLSIDQGQGLGK